MVQLVDKLKSFAEGILLLLHHHPLYHAADTSCRSQWIICRKISPERYPLRSLIYLL
jgi:hypothetical protein